MKNSSKAISILEYDKIRELLAECAPTQGAKIRALSLEPDTVIDRIRAEMAKTSAAQKLIGTKGMPSFYGVFDISSSLEKAEKGGCMTTRELLDIASLLNCASGLKSYIGVNREGVEVIAEYFDRLESDRTIERAIGNAIVSEDMIADEASPELSHIRKKIRTVNNRIKDTLQKYTSDSSYTKYLQENIVTMRNGRYVIPVRSECKSEIRGLMHDISSSGATVFIEPIAIVEANNELHILSIEEEREIEKILFSLTSMCLNIQDKLSLNYYNITELAFAFTKAEFSFRIGGTEPVINRDKKLELIKARHPLLDKKKVVPISVSLGDTFDTLVITGPNTGGKTVTLKTIGLFALMAQSGLHIPASEGSSVCVFSSVYADIGDEQSIEQSLSTFSAHMKNIVHITSEADEDSLCLFDELGAGTDPTEGAALAISIISEIRSRGALCAATTHYSELKIFALETPGVCNGSCEFDVTTLAPTYRLIIGTPGKSNAFAISEKLGLSKSIVDSAKARISGDERRFESVIANLENERVIMEKNRREAEAIKRSYEEKYSKLESEMKKKFLESEKDADRAKREAQALLVSVKASTRYLLEELNDLKKRQNERGFSGDVDEMRRKVKHELEKLDDSVNPVIKEKEEEYVLPRPLKNGDEVFIVALGKNGFVESDPDKSGNVRVTSGIFTSQVNISGLRLVEEEVTVIDKKGSKRKASDYRPEPVKSFSIELDIRGETGEDGWMMVDKYIDEAIIMKVSPVRIVHGKGTGALRAYIHKCLRKDKRVKSFRLGEYGEGDSGVTVIELK